MEQFFIDLFGLTAMWLAFGKSDSQRKLAPIAGLLGQPFWMYFAVKNGGWGILILTFCYTAVYLRGFIVQWGLLLKIESFLKTHFKW
jgi:hypothetical protein